MRMMYRRSLVLVGVLATLGFGSAALAGTPASSRSQDPPVVAEQLQVKIPFNFQIGQETMGAGTYSIAPVDPADMTTWQITHDTKQVLGTFDTKGVTTGKPMKRSEVVFDEYNHRDYLAQIWVAGSDSGRQLVQLAPQSEMTGQHPRVKRVKAYEMKGESGNGWQSDQGNDQGAKNSGWGH